MPRGKRDKDRIDWLHFRKRIWERFRIGLDRKDYLKLISQAQASLGSTPFENPAPGDRYLVHLVFEGKEFDVIYDHQVQSIVTALHPDEKKTPTITEARDFPSFTDKARR